MLCLQITKHKGAKVQEFFSSSIFRSQEFDDYRIAEPTTITFCLKELRAILNFADALSLDMTINFESAGKYVVDVMEFVVRVVYEVKCFTGRLCLLSVVWMFLRQIL